MDNSGERIADYDPDISILLGLQSNRKRETLSTVSSYLPPSKRRKIGFSFKSASPVNENSFSSNRFSLFDQQQEP